MNILPALMLSLFTLAPVSVSAESQPSKELPCIPSSAGTPICGVHAPEDMELLPNDKQLVISKLATNSAPGGLAILNLADNRILSLPTEIERASDWGDRSCTRPPEPMSPHGIHVSKRQSGSWQLLVVNHGERESIEMFELIVKDASYKFIWRGCVVDAANAIYNDVAGLPDGGFVATVKIDKSLLAKSDISQLMSSGVDTGYLVEWHSNLGAVKLPASDGPYNNGIQLSRETNFIYFAATTAKQIRKYDRRLHRVTTTLALPFYPDNLTLQTDGTMLVAGFPELRNSKNCTERSDPSCLMAFAVATINPETDTVTPLYAGAAGVMHGASVALVVRGSLFIGTFAGDRILKIALPPSRKP